MVNLPKLVKKTLSDVLVQEGLVQPNHLAEAGSRQKTTGEPLATVLQKMGVISEIELARAFAKQFNLPYIDASHYAIPKQVAEAVVQSVTTPLELGKYQYVVLDKIGKAMLVAVADLPPLETLEAAERALGSTLFVFISTPSQVQAAIKKHYANLDGGAPKAAPQTAVKAAPAVQAAPKK